MTRSPHHDRSNRQSRKRHYSKHQQPKRGGPGILWTCETGREGKCRREGMDVLQYYYQQQPHGSSRSCGSSSGSDASSKCSANCSNGRLADEATKLPDTLAAVSHEPERRGDIMPDHPSEPVAKLSLEDELAMLKTLNKRGSSAQLTHDELPFAEYETGCRGTVFMLFTGAEMTDDAVSNDSAKVVAEDETEAKKARVEHSSSDPVDRDSVKRTGSGSAPNAMSEEASTMPKRCASWQPLTTVLAVFEDLIKEISTKNPRSRVGSESHHSEDNIQGNHISLSSTSLIPSSRFITRMIPIQSTCFASLDEIQDTVKTLLSEHESSVSSQQTYAIHVKRRCLEHLTSQDMIRAIAQTVGTSRPQWKVDLRMPDVTVWVETCKTLVGISIIPKSVLSVVRNFNVAEVRARVGAATE